MKVKEIISEAIITQHLLYDPNDARGPYNMTADEQEEESPLETCGSCNGTGEGMYPGSKCHTCKGEGVIDNRDPEDDYSPEMEHDYNTQ